MSMLGALLRRARIRGLVEQLVQSARVESTEHDAKEDAERFQDYGFAANPVDGQGLVLNVAGHTIVLRMDRLAERPELAAHEVTVWHKEGHRVTLKAGRLVQVECDTLQVDASVGVVINTPTMTVNADDEVALNTPNVAASDTVTSPTVAATTSLTVQGDEVFEHDHGGVDRGLQRTDPM